MLPNMLTWLHSDNTLKLVALLIAGAEVTKAYAQPHTIAFQIAEGVIALGVVLGVYSTTGRAAK